MRVSGRLGIDARFEPGAPKLDARVGGDVELVLGKLRPARAAGPKAARVQGLEMVHPLGEIGGGVLAARLVAVGHQEERGMIAVGLEDAVRLVIDPLVHRLAVADGGGLVGPAGLDLVIEAEFVRRHKGRFRRAVGMEANQVQPVRLGDADDALPGLPRRWADGR